MIHDILLSFVTVSDCGIIQKLCKSEVLPNFLHPAEVTTLKDIQKLSSEYKEIWEFALKYQNIIEDSEREPRENELPPGLYLQAFADGIIESLKVFQKNVVELEKKYLKKPNYSLMFIYSELEKFHPLFDFLYSLINGLKSQKLHGCVILQFLQQSVLHGSSEVIEAVLTIQRSIYIVFIHHLTEWILYGKIVDNYQEFFIQYVESAKQQLNSVHSATTFQSVPSSEATSTADFWHYEICYDMLPNHFSSRWAEKVLFIGQTVVMFNSDPRDLRNKIWSSESMDQLDGEAAALSLTRKKSIWGEQEYEFFKKFHHLQEKEKMTVENFEIVVDEIKLHVAEHLSEIAIKEADLIKNLKIMKDFFLLGRGELFYEFVKEVSGIFSKVVTEGTVRDINRAFQVAGSSVNVGDEVDLFQFHMNKEEIDSFSYETKGFINFVTLKYKVRWPLHLLFTAKVLEKYNDLFRFLLRIKKTQYDLHMIWCYHRANKVERSSELLQFRNKLMFLIDNLQYYLQVDVLESQFSILMDKIQESRDFEYIQRSHAVFQANILGLCFLLESTETPKSSQQSSDNPVLSILNKIINLVDTFSTFIYQCSNPLNEIEKEQFKTFELLFSGLMDSLLKMLIGLKAGPSSAPLSQLLLRLDFNYWFSSQTKK